jgi:aspartate/glutamate racemase
MAEQTTRPFITMDVRTLRSFDKLMRNGLRGTHVLFSNGMIQEAFRHDRLTDLLSDQDVPNKVQEALTHLLKQDDLEERQRYIESLETAIRNVLVHLYFNFLDNYLQSNQGPEVVN